MSGAYLPRTLEGFLLKASQTFPVVMLTGPRQVGKTTLLQHVAQQEGVARRYVSLDDPLLLGLARDEPALFLQRYSPPVLIDEIQYAPQLLPLIKALVDQDGRKGLVWLTGSQPFHLMQGVGESLAGRVAVVNLQGLSLCEAQGSAGMTSVPFVPQPGLAASTTRLAAPHAPALPWVYQRIWQGSFPALAQARPPDHGLFFSSYVQTYVQRDVRQLAQVGDLGAFARFLRSAAARTAQLLNVADMARDVGVAPNTARHWLSILQASGLIHLLGPFHTSLSKRLVKTPKLYFLDTGLAAWLTGWTSPTTLEAGAMSGALFETWVMAELLKGWWHHGQEAPIYFYRDRDQREIDALIVRDGRAHPVEIKKTAQPSREAVRHFGSLQGLGPEPGHGAVICLCQEITPLTAQVDVVPAWALGNYGGGEGGGASR
jgi:predicted AAA+ superfamily ATPase